MRLSVNIQKRVVSRRN